MLHESRRRRQQSSGWPALHSSRISHRVAAFIFYI